VLFRQKEELVLESDRSEVCITTFSRSEQALHIPISHLGQPFPTHPLVAYPPSCHLRAAISTFPHPVNVACVRQPQHHRSGTVLRTARHLSTATPNPPRPT